MTLVEFAITPIGKGESLSAWVARAVEVIDRSGLKYQVGPMSTCIEGEWEEIFRVLGRCLHEIEKDCNRITMSIKVDHRKNRTGAMEDKVKAVARVLGRPIKTASP